MGVQAARVRKHPELGPAQQHLLLSCARFRTIEPVTVRRETHHCHNARIPLRNARLEGACAFAQLVPGQLISARRRAPHKICHAETGIREASPFRVVESRRERSSGIVDACLPQRGEEAIARVRKGRLRRRSPQPRVDSDKEKSNAIGDEVGNDGIPELLEFNFRKPHHAIIQCRFSGPDQRTRDNSFYRGVVTLKTKLFWSALAGVASAAAGLAIAEAIALVIAPASSPLIAVGSLVIDLAPTWAKDFAIAAFGTNDKIFLLTLIVVLLTALAAGAGALQLFTAPWGLVTFGVIGGIATIAATTREQSLASWAIPSVVGMLGAALMLYRIVTKLGVWTATAQTVAAKGDQRASGVSRRDFFVYIASTAVGAAVIGIGARTVNATTIAAAAVRKAIKLPAPALAAPAIPDGAALDVPGITPLITPNADFYRIDTALQVPSIDASDWSLRVTGMVEEPFEITFDELLALPLTERNITLMCVSNEIGGDLTGNATWLGYPLHKILERAKPQSGANMVLSRSIDGFTAGTPLDVLQETDRDCLLAVGMNGEPLPLEHGFPVRMVVPGLYGYVSATKWVVELELTTYERSRAYWTDRGWSAKGPVKTCSRIDVPTARQTLDSGTIVIAGIAWAQHTGIEAVEVRIDGGEWMPARLAAPISDDTWVQWALDWDASSGAHVIEARATDKDGTVQSGQFAPVAPNGAEGWDSVRLDVA